MNVLCLVESLKPLMSSLGNELSVNPLKDNAKLHFCFVTSKFFCVILLFVLKKLVFVFADRIFLRLLRLTFTFDILLKEHVFTIKNSISKLPYPITENQQAGFP